MCDAEEDYFEYLGLESSRREEISAAASFFFGRNSVSRAEIFWSHYTRKSPDLNARCSSEDAGNTRYYVGPIQYKLNFDFRWMCSVW